MSRFERFEGRPAAAAIVLVFAAAAVVFAQDTGATRPQPSFSLGKTFTFLFVTLGPLKVFGPFAAMTRGRDASFKRRLAFEGTVNAAIAIVASATLGANVMEKWGVSAEAQLLTVGIVLFLIALRPVLEQYAPHESKPDAASPAVDKPVSALAFSPLAFPTIVTPYGIAVLILIVTLSRGNHARLLEILITAGFVLLLDLLAMLYADRVLKAPFVAPALAIIGAVMAVLQVALSVQAIVGALTLLGFTAGVNG
jgi:multiple antibiotic resistance protein